MSRPVVTMIIGSALRGGAEGQAVGVACGLSSRGYDVRMLFLSHGGPHTASLDACGVPWEIVGAKREGRFAAWKFSGTLRLLRLLRSHRPDVVIAWMAGAISAIPVFAPVVRAATVAAFRGEQGAETVDFSRLRRGLVRLGTRRADLIAVNSPTLEAEARAWGASDESIRVVPNGVDLPSPVPGVDGQPPTAVVVANLRPVKNIPLVVEALALVEHPVTVRVCGEGDRDPLLDLARRLGVADRIQFVESPADVPAEIAASQFGIHPSLSEGLPNAVLEIMAHGRPVVATDVGGVPTLVDNGVTGLLVESDDARALALAIDAMSSSPDRRAALGRAARERAAEFSWEASLGMHVALLDELLGKRRRARGRHAPDGDEVSSDRPSGPTR